MKIAEMIIMGLLTGMALLIATLMILFIIEIIRRK